MARTIADLVKRRDELMEQLAEVLAEISARAGEAPQVIPEKRARKAASG